MSNSRRDGEAIEAILNKFLEVARLLQGAGYIEVEVDDSAFGQARAELAAYRELLRAAKAIAEESINKVASIKLCDDLLAAIAALEAR